MQVLVSEVPTVAKVHYTMRQVDTGKGVVAEVTPEEFANYQQTVTSNTAWQKRLGEIWKNPPHLKTAGK